MPTASMTKLSKLLEEMITEVFGEGFSVLSGEDRELGGLTKADDTDDPSGSREGDLGVDQKFEKLILDKALRDAFSQMI